MVMIAEQDTDGDGKIGFDEMRKMFITNGGKHQVVEAKEDLTQGAALRRTQTDPAQGKKTV